MPKRAGNVAFHRLCAQHFSASIARPHRQRQRRSSPECLPPNHVLQQKVRLPGCRACQRSELPRLLGPHHSRQPFPHSPLFSEGTGTFDLPRTSPTHDVNVAVAPQKRPFDEASFRGNYSGAPPTRPPIAGEPALSAVAPQAILAAFALSGLQTGLAQPSSKTFDSRDPCRAL